jgi:hypothetical protein
VFGPKDTFFTRFSYENYALIAPQGQADCCLPSNPAQVSEYDLGPWIAGVQNTLVTAQGLAVNETHIFSPTLVNEFIGGYARLNSYTAQTDIGHYDATALGIQNININPNLTGLPNLLIQNFTGIDSGPDNTPAHAIDTEPQLGDTISWVKGSHQLVFGFRGILNLEHALLNTVGRGEVYFCDHFTNNPVTATGGSGIATLLTGYTTEDTREFMTSPGYLNVYQYGAFAQDNWKVNSRLTLNLGLRWDDFMPATEEHNNLENFDPATNTLIYAGVDGTSDTGDLKNRLDNFAPRIGFAYDPTGSGKTAIRGGYGIVYFPMGPSGGSELDTNVPHTIRANIVPATYPLGSQMSSVTTIGCPFGGPPVSVQPLTTAALNSDAPSIVAWAFANQTAYMETYTLNVQRQITPSLLFQVGYAGSRGIHLMEEENMNQVQPGPGSDASRRLIPQLDNVSTIDYIFPGNMSNYNSLQVQVQKNLSSGMQFLLAYTYSKSLDYAGSVANGGGEVGNPQTYTDLAAGYGPSGFDIGSRLVGNWVYQLPAGPGRHFLRSGPLSHVLGGWEFDGIGTIETGLPFSVSLNSGVNNGAPSWPNRVCNGALPNPGPSLWFNTACFVDPPDYTYGNVARGVLFGPGTTELDLALLRNFTLSERLNLQFRGEAFNAFNTPNFSNDDLTTAIGSPTAGVITGTNIDNREFEFALKLTF